MGILEGAPRKRRRTRRVWVAVVLALAVLAGAAWRWAPRPAAEATGQMREAAEQLASSTPASETTPASPAPPSDPKGDRERLIVAANMMKGIPYEWGAKGPDKYDCSGFTKAAYAKVDVDLPDGSFNQAKGEKPLGDVAEMVPGDLILYRWAGSKGVKHVTMYAGDGWVIGTGTPGQLGEVTLYPLTADLVDDGRVITYRHIVLPDER